MSTNDDPLAGIDPLKLIGLIDAAKLMRGARGRKSPNVETVRRWANPRRGYRVLGHDGPPLLLKSIRINGDLLTLPEWVAEFERQRLIMGLRGGAS